MSYSSSASQRLLESMFEGDTARDQVQAEHYVVPTMIKVADPVGDIEEALSYLPGGEALEPPSRRRHPWLAKRDGKPTGLPARMCCLDLSRRLEARLAYIKIPSEHLCEVCGTRWRIEHRVRGGRHG